MLAALALTACGGGSQPGPAVEFDARLVRLEPVEAASGEPAILAVLEADPTLRLEPAAEPSAWTVSGGGVRPDREGRVVVRADLPGEPVVLARADLALALDAVTRLELVGELTAAGAFAVELELAPGSEALATRFEQSQDRPGPLRFQRPVSGRGTVIGVRLELPSGARLDHLELGPGSPALGASPRTVDGVPFDGGLRDLGRGPGGRGVARRAHPARLGRPQVAPYDAGGDALLVGAFALDPDRAASGRGLRLTVAALPPDGTDPDRARPLHRRELAATDAGTWHPFTVELPGEAGQEWTLVLRVEGDGPAGSVAGHWAGPVLVRRAAPRPPDLVLITADTLRSDHVAATRAAVGAPPLASLATPFLDGLAARGTNFADALATSNATSPSHASILTGHYPRDHRVIENDRTLSEAATTLGELLSERYLCVSAVTAGHLDADVSGLGQGFDVALAAPPQPPPPRPTRVPRGLEDLPPFDPGRWIPEAEWANAGLLALLAELDEVPLFLWLHYFDPHTPYRVGETTRALLPAAEPDAVPALLELARRRAAAQGREVDDQTALFGLLLARPDLSFLQGFGSLERARDLYAAGASELDHQLGLLFEALGERGRDAHVLFTADHGEALGEREVWFEHGGVYDNTLHVPLILAGPGLPEGALSRAPVSTLDVLPTLAALAGVEAPADLPGRSLLGPGLDAERRRWFQHSGAIEAGYRQGDEHVVVVGYRHPLGLGEVWREAGTVERLVDGRPTPLTEERRAALAAEVEAWVASPVLDLESIEADLDEAARAQLRALGYGDD